MGLSGSFYGATITTTAGIDLIEEIESTIGESIIVKKMTMITDSDITISINGGVNSHLYQDSTDSMYKLSLEANDVEISSLVVTEDAIDIYIAIIY